MAYYTGTLEWDVLEVSLATGNVRTMVAAGGVSWWPDWAPSGTHYLIATAYRGNRARIEDVSPDGFSRVLLEREMSTLSGPRWSPDGARFVYVAIDTQKNSASLMLANASGGGASEIGKLEIPTLQLSWSPDGQWITGLLPTREGKRNVAKIRASPGSSPVILAETPPVPGSNHAAAEWSPAGNGILYRSEEGIAMVSPEGGPPRKVSARRLDVFGFSKDPRQVFGIFHNVTGSGAEWQLYSVDVATGAEKMIGPVDLPASVQSIAGFSIHPDGKRALISVAKWPFDIWMLEGFDQPRTSYSFFK
jgi:dipeptidyl aminopeptidase/acylaminoacyl peptidase